MIQKRWVNTTDLNTKGVLFGGRLLTWMDEDASIVVAENIDSDFVTGRVFCSDFLKPVEIGELLTFEYTIAHTSRATITVKAEVFNRKHDLVFRSYISFVGVKDGKPISICCKTKVDITSCSWQFVESYLKFIKEIQ